MSIVAYVTFNGNCSEALDFYAAAFKTEKLEVMTWKDAPGGPDFVVPEEAKELVMNTSLNICGGSVMFADSFLGMPVTMGDNISLTLITSSMDDIDYYFDKIKEGGTIIMELQETFWTKKYGSIKDKFGVTWQFSHDPEA